MELALWNTTQNTMETAEKLYVFTFDGYNQYKV